MEWNCFLPLCWTLSRIRNEQTDRQVGTPSSEHEWPAERAQRPGVQVPPDRSCQLTNQRGTAGGGVRFPLSLSVLSLESCAHATATALGNRFCTGGHTCSLLSDARHPCCGEVMPGSQPIDGAQALLWQTRFLSMKVTFPATLFGTRDVSISSSSASPTRVAAALASPGGAQEWVRRPGSENRLTWTSPSSASRSSRPWTHGARVH